MEKKKPAVWDCDSSLYDSFELKSFKRQLDYAIASRTLSMPRVVAVPVVDDHKAPSGAASCAAAKDQGRGRPAKKISKSIQKVLKAMLFRKKPHQKAPAAEKEKPEAAAAAPAAQVGLVVDSDFNFRDVTWIGIGVGVGGLETIPEVPEKGCGGDGTPESVWWAVRKTVSERFAGRVGVFR